MKLLSIGTNAKTVKSDKSSQYLTAILYMAPAKLNDKGVNLCPKASAGCLAACLNTAGRGQFNNVKQARLNKANWFVNDRKSFLEQLRKDLSAFERKCQRENKKPAVRLNGTSDILWENLGIMNEFPIIEFYDYTNWDPARRLKLPENYHLTFSKTEEHDDAFVVRTATMNRNVAMVFNGKLPKVYQGIKVIDGDKTDLRFLDPKGVIVGLSAKGKAKKDTSGFVIHQEPV